MSSVVERLKLLSSGERAALRRGAGTSLSEADGRALASFFRIIPRLNTEREMFCWYVAATIACLWDIEEASECDGMARMLKKYQANHATNGMEARLRTLLDIHWEYDGYLEEKLSRLARMLRSDDRSKMPDMDRLLNDLMYWNSDRRNVQIRWAKEFYFTESEEATENVD